MFADMFFQLSKILDFLINPFNWVVALFGIGLIFLWKGKKSAKKWLLASFLTIVFFTNPLILSVVMIKWDYPSYPAKNITQPYEIGILLGGSMRHYDEINERPVYSMSVDRLMQTIALYKSGKIRKILLTGGSGHVFLQHQKESDIIRVVLNQAGVPDEDILVENQSRNTYENAAFTAKLIREENINGKFLVITSASHMRRTIACFKKTGLAVDPFPVDGKSQTFSWTPDTFILPEPHAFGAWDSYIHEWAGMIAYKISGYI